MDSVLSKRLNALDAQNDVLNKVEAEYLELEANRKPLLAQLTINSPGKSYAEREANALASKAWLDFMKGHAAAETRLNFEKRRYEILDKAYLAEHATFTREAKLIGRHGAA